MWGIPTHQSLRRPHMSTTRRINSLKAMEMDGTKLFTLFVYVFLFYFSILYRARCEIYTVGDDEQWSTGVNYNAWSSKYDFAINDTLVFKYIKGAHNVYEVTQDTYRSCNGSSGVLAKYSSGKDEIKLTEAKEYWFICDIAGHCLGGMRFPVNLTQASSAVPSTGTGNDTTRSPGSAIKPVPVYIYIFVVGIFACLYY